jgi:hypothetical protein
MGEEQPIYSTVLSPVIYLDGGQISTENGGNIGQLLFPFPVVVESK